MAEKPKRGAAAKSEASRRKARQADALRANLRRRKDQARGRDDEDVPAPMTKHAAEARLQAVLDFWFRSAGDPDHGEYRDIWFKKDDAFDAEIRARFERDLEIAASGGYDHLTGSPLGSLAVIIILDQFSRNLCRGQARAFAADSRARGIADRALRAGFDRELLPAQRLFMYLPFEHSEDLADQHRCAELYRSLPPGNLRDHCVDYGERHKVIIERFGRFPHRNAALGRASTAEEIEFLKGPNSSF